MGYAARSYVHGCLSSPKISCTFAQRNTGCSSVRLECASGGREVAGSNPVIPTKVVETYCESSSQLWAALVAFERLVRDVSSTRVFSSPLISNL